MKTNRYIIKKMEHWILIAIISTLLLCVIASGSYLYKGLYHSIIQGFDTQLYSLSTVCSTFIDGKKHNTLLSSLAIRSLAYDQKGERFTAFSKKDQLYQVDMDTFLGGVDPVGKKGGGDILAHAWDGGALYTFDGESLQLYAQNGEMVFGSGPLNFTSAIDANGVFSMAILDKKLFLSSGNKVFEFKGGNNFFLAKSFDADEVIIASYSENILAYLKKGEKAWLEVLDQKFEKIHTWALDPEFEGGDSHQFKFRGIASDGGTFWGLTDNKLLWLSAVDNSGNDQEDFTVEVDLENIVSFRVIQSYLAEGFRSENDPVYVKYRDPLRRIKNSANITYLFTYTYDGMQDNSTGISYIVDPTEDPMEHTTIGYKDVVNDKEAEDLRHVYENGMPKIGEIRLFPQWGLLKNASSPIFDENGKVAALVGVDIDVDIINKKTRMALLKVMVVGILSLIGALLVSYAVAKRITLPLLVIREAALKTAAGDHYGDLELKGAKEIQELGRKFQSVAVEAKKYITTLDDANSFSLESKSKDYISQKLFSRVIASATDYQIETLAGHKICSVSCKDYTVFWFIAEVTVNYDIIKQNLYKKELIKLLLLTEKDWDKIVKEAFYIIDQNFYCIVHDKKELVGFNHARKKTEVQKIEI